MSNERRLGVLALGNLGCRSIKTLEQSGELAKHKEFSVCVANTDRAQLADFFPSVYGRPVKTNQQLRTVLLGKKGLGAGGDPKAGRKAFEESKPQIENFFREPGGAPLTILAILAGLGGGTCGAAAAAAECAINDFGIDAFVMASMPFRWEGPGVRRKAQESKQELLTIAPTALIYNNWVPKNLDMALTFSEIVRESIVPTLTFLQKSTLTVGNVINRDNADVIRVLRAGKYPLIGATKVPRGEEFDKMGDRELIALIVNNLFAKLYQDRSIILRSCDQTLWLDGRWWNSGRIELLYNALRASGTPPETFESRCAINISDQDEESSVGIIAVAKDAGAEVKDDGENPWPQTQVPIPAQTTASTPVPTNKTEEPKVVCYVPDERTGSRLEVWLPPDIANTLKRVLEFTKPNGKGHTDLPSREEVDVAVKYVEEHEHFKPAIPPSFQQELRKAPSSLTH